jgi:uncharacterized damage-inducible protein DinB
MIEQLIETWEINNRVTLLLLANLDEKALQQTLSARGGRTAGQQLAHVYAVRRGWIEIADKKLLAELPPIEREDGHDKALLIEGFTKSAAALTAIIRQSGGNDGKVKGFKRGIIPLVGYMIAHEAHHRGSLLLTLKQSGFKLNDELRWGIWDWQKL